MSNVIKHPTTYAEWCELFDMLKQKTDDDLIYMAMKKGVFVWQTDISKRFMQKLLDVINSRFKSATDLLQSSLSKAQGQEITIVQALQMFRKEMIFLYDILNLPVIPINSREQYCSLFWSKVDNTQAILEHIGKTDRSGKLSKIILDHAVNIPINGTPLP